MWWERVKYLATCSVKAWLWRQSFTKGSFLMLLCLGFLFYLNYNLSWVFFSWFYFTSLNLYPFPCLFLFVSVCSCNLQVVEVTQKLSKCSGWRKHSIQPSKRKAISHHHSYGQNKDNRTEVAVPVPLPGTVCKWVSSQLPITHLTITDLLEMIVIWISVFDFFYSLFIAHVCIIPLRMVW